jgi:PST family polysaccharide transporter
MVGYFAVPSEIAYFKLAFGYLMLAMTVLGPVSTVMNIHFPTVQTTDSRNLARTFLRVTGYATLLSASVTAVVLVLAPFVFRILYGEEYLPALPYVYGLGVMGALFGIGAGLGAMWRSLGMVRVSIVINLIVLGIGIPLGIWMISEWGIWGAVLMVTVWYTASHVVSFLYLARALRRGAMSASMERL